MSLFTNVLAQSSGCVGAPIGLVAWWPGDGNANDLAGGSDGTVVGGLAFASGEVAQAFALNGLDSTVHIAASPSLDVGAANGLTIEAWINPADVSESDPVVEWSTQPPGVSHLGVHLWVGFPSAGCLFANVADTDDQTQWRMIYSAPGAVQANAFQHVALTYDKATGMARLFLNGATVAGQSLGTFRPETTFDLYIGQRPGFATFRGVIDEVSLYNRALSSNEIAAIYAASSVGKCMGAPVILNQPIGQNADLGDNVTFDILAGGTPPLSYQWRLNGTNLPGATNATLSLNNVRISDAGTYSAEVTNSLDRVASSDAVLNVLPPSLQISRSGSAVIIWWPVNASGFGMETSTSLGPSQNWTPWADPVVVIGDQNIIATDASPRAKFFRLRLP